jgi:hypothetical protein
LSDENTPQPDKDVTTQPSISTAEAAQTDVELSPVGDAKAKATDPDTSRVVEPER